MATRFMKAGEDSPGFEDLHARARGLIPRIAARADATAKARCIPKETIDDIRDAGLFKILQPARWGGYELSPRAFFEVQTILAEADMSVGWVFGVIGVHNWHLALFDDRAANDVWGDDPTVLMASTYMPVGKVRFEGDGYRLSGRWKFSSGCDNCDWVLLGGQIPQPDGTVKHGTLLVPRADLRIVDSWHVSGLRGTGSNDIVVEDAFVPAHRVHLHEWAFHCQSPGNAVNTGWLYRLPFGQVFIRAVNSASIGALQALADAAVDYSAAKIAQFGGKNVDSTATHRALAETREALAEMRLALAHNFEVLERHARLGEAPSIEDRSLFKFQAAHIASRAAELGNRLYRTLGGSILFDDQPFGRIVSDLLAGQQHLYNQAEPLAENFGAILLGRENKDFFL